MMTVSLRAAQPSQLRISLAAARSCLLLMLLCVFGASAFGQGLTPSTAITFGDLNLGVTGTFSQQFTGPSGGVTIQSVTAVTEGAPGEDFSVISTTCIGTITLPNTCSVNLAFKPTQIGLRLGALLVTNSAGVVVNTIYLSGVGVGPQLVLSPATAVATNSATTLTPANFTAGAAVQDGVGDLFFTDVTNNRILELSAAGVYSELVALPVSATSGLAIDGVGNLYVSSGSAVYTISPSATTPTATALTISGVTLGTLTGLAVDLIGDLYIADSTNNKIYQLPLGSTSANTLTLTGVSLSGPTGLAIDASSNLYIADSGNNRIVENPLGSNTATVVTLSSLTLSNPTGVAVDAAGTLYIADTGHSRVVESTVTGVQFALADPGLTLTTPASVLIQGSPQTSPNAQYNGDLVISDTTLGLVVVERSGPIGPNPTPTITFPTPTVLGTLDTADNPTTFLTVQETGNIVSTLTAGPDPNFTGADPTAFLLGTSVSPAAALCPSLGTGAAPSPADNFSIGQVCTYNVNFEPTVVGPNTANLILATSAAGGTLTAGGTATLLGTGLSTVKSFSLVATPATIFLGNSVELILTALQADGTTVATDYTGTITFTTTDSTGKYLGGTGTGTQTSVYTLTAADKGILVIPATAGLQLNQYGVWTATATADPTSLPPGANGVAISNPVTVIEPSTLTLTSTVNPSLVNESTTFTLTVATTGTVTPGGTVTFYNGAAVIGTASLVTASATTATASIADSFAASGTYPIKVVYASTSNTLGGTATLTQLVGNATSLTLTSSINPSLVGQSTNLTATITSNPVFGAITGSVQFFDGATSLGTVTVNGTPTATLPVSFTTAGTHTLKAVFTSTNVNITNATSAPYAQQVLNVAQLGLTSSVNPSLPAQSTTLTATLTSLGTPTGTVKFYDGATLIGTAPLSGTTASVSVSFTTTGNHILTAVYSGDTLTQGVTSAPLTQVVLYTTTVSLTTSVNPVNVNANTLLTAAVKSTGTVAATGTVTFKSNGVTIGTGTVNGGVATLAASFPAPGTYTLTAVYSGDANNQPATSAPIQQTVLGLVTVSLTSSVNPILLDNPTILTATLVSTGTTPTGTISFFDGNTPIGTGAIVNGMVSISASFVYAGPHTLTAAYSGDAANAPATSPGLSETAADFTLTVASGSSSIGTTIAGGTATYALVLTPIITTTLPAPVTLTVTGLPSNDTGTLTPTTIATGSGITPVSLSVTAGAIVAALHRQPRPTHRSALAYVPVALALMVLPLAWFRRRKRFGSLLASLCLLFAFTAGLTGCISAANTGYYGQTPQTYNLTVTATSGNLTRSTYLTLTVQ
jgi:sugar lactone lactonase YvrE